MNIHKSRNCRNSISNLKFHVSLYRIMQTEKRINLEEPRYDQGTFTGRARHFFITTNPFNILATSQQLEDAKAVVERYR